MPILSLELQQPLPNSVEGPVCAPLSVHMPLVGRAPPDVPPIDANFPRVEK
jgi:hypothetical protein